MKFWQEAQRLAVYFGTALVILTIAGWTIYRSIEPGRMVLKWVATFLVLALLIFKVAPLVGGLDMAAAFVGIPLVALCGLALGIIWRHELSDLVGNPIASLYDGGSTPPEPKPLYSIAQAKQKKGLYHEAAQEVLKQLSMFPDDLEGHMLLAGIQAENLHDLDAAEETILDFCSSPGRQPRAIVFALYALADWRIALRQDGAGARRALEKVLELLPDSEFVPGAQQRIAHLGDPAAMAADAEKKFQVRSGIQNLGLLADMKGAVSSEKAEQVVLDCLRHLEQHPMDVEVRHRLAGLYVDHYHRLDLATNEIEQIIATPKQPARVIIQALTALADLQKKSGADYATIRSTLERIIACDPRCAAAEQARRRIELLRLELKANAAPTPVHLGTYEQDIGLKSNRSRDS